MSRPNVTDEIISGLAFARACVLDQQVASHARHDHSFDERYLAALSAIDTIANAHRRAARKAGGK